MEDKQDDPLERDTVLMPRSYWEGVRRYQAKTGMRTKAEAHRQVVRIGLAAIDRQTERDEGSE